MSSRTHQPAAFYANIIRLHFAVDDLPNALNLSEEQFEKKYGKPKPTKSTKIIFYCQIGIRSAKATVDAADLGYAK